MSTKEEVIVEIRGFIAELRQSPIADKFKDIDDDTLIIAAMGGYIAGGVCGLDTPRKVMQKHITETAETFSKIIQTGIVPK